MTYLVLESDYMGFHLKHDPLEDDGWTCIIGEYEYRFQYLQDAHATIRKILEGSKDIIKQYNGKKVQKVGKEYITRVIDEEVFEQIKKEARG